MFDVHSLTDTRYEVDDGLAWITTLAEALRQGARWAASLEAQDRLGDGETLALKVAAGEYLAQLVHGIPMSQNEFVRPHELGLESARRRSAEELKRLPEPMRRLDPDVEPFPVAVSDGLQALRDELAATV